MSKLDYKNLLGNYTKIPIDTRDLSSLLEMETFDLESINPNLYSFLKYFDINKRHYLIKDAFINKEGIFLDLTALKNYLIDFYNLPNDKNLIDNINNLYEKWDSNREYYFDLDSAAVKKIMYDIILPDKIFGFKKHNFMKQDQFYKEYLKNVLRLNKVESMEKLCEKTAMSGLECLKEILIDEKKYSKINKEFDKDKLGLYTAYVIYDYAEMFNKKDMNDRYNNAINYLTKYVNENQDLLEQDYSFANKNITNFEMKNYNIFEINSYLKINDYRKRLNQDKLVINDNNIALLITNNFVDFKGNDYNRFLHKFSKEINELKASAKANENLARKMTLYKSLNIKGIKKGINSFEGYLALILDTGEVLLDRIYDNICLGKASEHVSIYIVSYKDFELLSRMERKDAMIALKTGNIKNTKITHSVGFEEKVNNHIKIMKRAK